MQQQQTKKRNNRPFSDKINVFYSLSVGLSSKAFRIFYRFWQVFWLVPFGPVFPYNYSVAQ